VSRRAVVVVGSAEEDDWIVMRRIATGAGVTPARPTQSRTEIMIVVGTGMIADHVHRSRREPSPARIDTARAGRVFNLFDETAIAIGINHHFLPAYPHESTASVTPFPVIEEEEEEGGVIVEGEEWIWVPFFYLGKIISNPNLFFLFYILVLLYKERTLKFLGFRVLGIKMGQGPNC